MPTFTIDLSKPTYLDKGFINPGISASDFLGKHEERIELQLTDLSGTVLTLNARINRTANSNGSPRLCFGRELSSWYYKNSLEDKIILVEIVNSSAIRIDLRKQETPLPAEGDILEPLSNDAGGECAISRITAIGFRKVGEWQLDDNNRLNCGFFDDPASQMSMTGKNSLYAFSDDCVIYYIGKTTRELRRRMNDYSLGYENLKTNKKCHDKIRQMLEDKKHVYVYSFYLPSQLQFGEFAINIAAALEDSLICRVGKIWNGRQKTVDEKIDEANSDELDNN